MRLIAVLVVAAAVAMGCSPSEEPAEVKVARDVVDDVVHARWSDVRERFDTTMKRELPSVRLATAWASFVRLKGRFESQGNAEVLERGDFKVVNIGLHMRKSDGQARVTFDERGRIAGLFFLRPGVPVP